MSNDFAPWPPVRYEELAWEPSHPGLMSRTQQKRHRGPYSSAVVPEIASVAGLGLAPETLAAADDASAEIVRFDANAGELLPFAALLLRSESAASSQIENLTASARAIALAEMQTPSTTNGDIIVANTRAMEAAIDLAGRLDGDAILETHRALLEVSQPSIVGKWRDQPVWIGGTAFGPHLADFVPPHHNRVADAMADLVTFMGSDGHPALPHAALAHAQFETIHPFPDGNGRTGRALLHAMLRATGLTRNVTVPISAGLLSDVDAYFAALGAYREGNPDEVVLLVADASFVAIANGRRLVEDLRSAKAEWLDTVKARSDSAVWKIIDLLTRQPIIDSPLVQRETGVAAGNALAAIERLEDAGVIRETSGQGRNRIWQADQILVALDEFSARAGRRSG